MQPFYFNEYTYSGSTIKIEVERDTGTAELPNGAIVTLHTIHGYIDDVEEVAEDNPAEAAPPLYPAILDRIASIEVDLKAAIDSSDTLDRIMIGAGYTGGSESIENYTVTPGSGSFTHNWTNDPDIDIESLVQADDAAFTVSVTTIHSGTLTGPITDGSYGSGVTKYFRIRGQRTGADPGPWSYGSGTTL